MIFAKPTNDAILTAKLFLNTIIIENSEEVEVKGLGFQLRIDQNE